jgi:hypothetical protein
MKSKGATLEGSFFLPDSSSLDDTTQQLKQILDPKYDEADLNQKVNKCLHLQERIIYTS